MMCRVYISGPFTGLTDLHVEQNIAAAAAFIPPIIEAGGSPVCMHTQLGPVRRRVGWDAAMAVCLDQLAPCDALLLIPGWQHSRGALQEYERSSDLHQEIFEATAPGVLPPDCVAWIGGNS